MLHIEQRPLSKADDVALQLNCGKSTVYKLAKDGKIPYVSIGTGVRFDLDSVLKALSRG
ncbi:MAG: helix-turn-helix domain-containing protein [Nitrospirales bacterium]